MQLQTAVGKNADGGWMLDLLVKTGWEVIWIQGLLCKYDQKKCLSATAISAKSAERGGEGKSAGAVP